MSISVQKISKSFKGRRKTEPENQVLKDVSFEVQEGEFVRVRENYYTYHHCRFSEAKRRSYQGKW